MSLPSINFPHLMVSEIQPGQTFSRYPPARSPAHLDTVGENNTPTVLPGCGVKKGNLSQHLFGLYLFSTENHLLQSQYPAHQNQTQMTKNCLHLFNFRFYNSTRTKVLLKQKLSAPQQQRVKMVNNGKDEDLWNKILVVIHTQVHVTLKGIKCVAVVHIIRKSISYSTKKIKSILCIYIFLSVNVTNFKTPPGPVIHQVIRLKEDAYDNDIAPVLNYICTKLGLHAPFNRQGHIRTGFQHTTCLNQIRHVQSIYKGEKLNTRSA